MVCLSPREAVLRIHRYFAHLFSEYPLIRRLSSATIYQTNDKGHKLSLPSTPNYLVALPKSVRFAFRAASIFPSTKC